MGKSAVRYILDKNLTLRCWNALGICLCNGPFEIIKRLPEIDDVSFLLSCDGVTEVNNEKLIEKYLLQGIIHPAVNDEKRTIEEMYHNYNTPYFGFAWIAITENCNFNCRHCFMAEDEKSNKNQLTKLECFHILSQFANCGIGDVRFTGGEPLLHPDFIEIVREAVRLKMKVSAILTNGSLITSALLDELLKMNCRPVFKISYDGVGKHDWMRGVVGAEQKTIRAISLCIEKGFEVCVHVCVNKKNIDTLMPTAKLLDSLGVSSIRLIRTSESPRWMMTSPEATLSSEKYFEEIVDFTEKYIDTGYRPKLNLWSMLIFDPVKRTAIPLPKPCLENEEKFYRRFLCGNTRDNFIVCADGKLYPCHAIVGPMRSYGVKVPNIFNESLQDILNDEIWMKSMHPRVSDLIVQSTECKDCKYLRECLGGCRAEAFTMTGKIDDKDPVKCMYFKGGYYDRLNKILDLRKIKVLSV
jgi:radical SAM protein with 4Fe4S-binding SPASM domain